MQPLYALCPHCGFPAVVRATERFVPRFCRQCRGHYVPCDEAEAKEAGNGRTGPMKRRKVAALRALLRPRHRGAV
jgi:hypothetical protein